MYVPRGTGQASTEACATTSALLFLTMQTRLKLEYICLPKLQITSIDCSADVALVSINSSHCCLGKPTFLFIWGGGGESDEKVSKTLVEIGLV